MKSKLIRMSDGLFQAVETLAKRQERTVVRQIVFMVVEYLREHYPELLPTTPEE